MSLLNFNPEMVGRHVSFFWNTHIIGNVVGPSRKGKEYVIVEFEIDENRFQVDICRLVDLKFWDIKNGKN